MFAFGFVDIDRERQLPADAPDISIEDSLGIAIQEIDQRIFDVADIFTSAFVKMGRLGNSGGDAEEGDRDFRSAVGQIDDSRGAGLAGIILGI